MPVWPMHNDYDPHKHGLPEYHLPHIGLRKIKSILAIFVGFLLWQLLRLLIPGLEVHPIFIYIYGMIEIRETSDKTKDYGQMRISATLVAIAVGIPMMLLADYLRPILELRWLQVGMEITVLLIGALFVLIFAEKAKCKVYVGLAAAIYIILLVSHFNSSGYLYSVMRAFQTIIGVCVAWIINVKLLPYPAKPGTFSYWLTEKLDKKKE